MKFSVIIPVYNVAPYLRECLDSVLAQLFIDWESICVDDGSTDASGAILDEYAMKDHRFKVIHQENAGVGVARNVALDKVQGDWITFVDADDRIDPWRLLFLAKLVQENPDVDWIHELEYSKVSMQGEKRLVLKDAIALNKIEGKDVFLFGWRTLKAGSLLWLNTYRATVLKAVRFPVGVCYAEDDIFELRALPYVLGYLEVRYGGYWYRTDREGAASRVIYVENSVKIHALLLEIVDEQWHIVDSFKDRDAFKQIFTQTVRKDFARVIRKWRQTSLEVRQQHRRVARKVAKCPYFEYRYIDGRCRVGYALYMRTGIACLMVAQDCFWQIGSTVKHWMLKLLNERLRAKEVVA